MVMLLAFVSLPTILNNLCDKPHSRSCEDLLSQKNLEVGQRIPDTGKGIEPQQASRVPYSR